MYFMFIFLHVTHWLGSLFHNLAMGLGSLFPYRYARM